MKKLVQINVSLNRGSTGHIAEELGRFVIDKGCESYIFYGRREQGSQSQKIKIGTKFDIYWHFLMTRLFDQHGLWSKGATKKLIKRIREIKPDIIHLHNIHGYYLNYKILFRYLKESNIPVVWTLHDCWSFTGHCVHFSFVNCRKWETSCKKCIQKKTYPSSFFIDRSYHNFLDKKESFLLNENSLILVPVSDWLADLCKQSFFKNIPIKCIHNGIDTDIFKPVSEEKKREILLKYDIKANFLILGVASVWSKRKGLDDFINLSSLIPNHYSIMLIGLSEQQLKYLPKNIIGIKRTENITELAAIYSSANVFVNPTWEDNFPTTNLESLSSGTPVIMYKTGGSVESITSETGYIIEQGDLDGLLKAIEDVDNKGKDAYSNACRKQVIDNFRKEERFLEYFQLYNRIIENKKTDIEI